MALPETKPAYYSFEVWDDDRVVSGAEVSVPGWKEAKVTLRLPPQSLSIEQGYRADFGIDLSGAPVVAAAGFGPGRWNLRGTHGVGPAGITMPSMRAVVPGLGSDGLESATLVTHGLGTRTDLQNLFLGFAKANQDRLAQGRPMLRLVFAIRGGRYSDFMNEEWAILPMGMPTDDRNAQRPHDWSFSITFWALARVKSKAVLPTAKAEDLRTIRDKIQAILKQIKRLNAFLDLNKNPLFQQVRDGLTSVTSLVYALKSVRQTVLNDVRAVAGLVDQAAVSVAVLRSAVDLATLRSDVKQPLKNSLNELRITLGLLKTTLRTNLEVAGVLPVPEQKPIPAIPGQDLRRIAATVFGDAARWTEIAAQNGMVFPWVAWGDQRGGMPPQALTPGAVALPGSSIEIPSQGSSRVAVEDRVGLDIIPTGQVDGAGRLALVGGAMNLGNALLRRLQTPKGYLPQHPAYGSTLHTYLGQQLDVPTALAIRAEVSRTLLQDPRVLSVKSVTLRSATDAGIEVDAEVDTVLGVIPVSTVGNSGYRLADASDMTSSAPSFPIQRTVSWTTDPLIQNETDADLIDLGKRWVISRIQASTPARVRIYTDEAAAFADRYRPMGVQIKAPHGLLAESINDAGALDVTFKPWAYGAPMGPMWLKVDDISSKATPAPVTVTITALQLE